MYRKSLLSFAVATALVGCGSDDPERINNDLGSLTISGDNTSGSVLSSELSDPDGVVASSVTYEWRAGGVAIDGATGSTFTLSNDQTGEDITLAVTYQDNAGLTETLVSSPIGGIIGRVDIAAAVLKGTVSGATCTLEEIGGDGTVYTCLLYTSPSPRDS